MLVFMFAFFILLCHYLAHRIAIGRSHLDLSLDGGISTSANVHSADSWFGDWFNWSALWGGGPSKTEAVGDFARILESGS